ncbi:SlyX family protein [uncultured Neptuniibacter sp.]|uniref:SlyX family protein n=1 Tax=uncultured Neptuniibacter sp. TaxID=502143 RepID=UPI002606F862|nr:SlyX family protein [uncultured Neptuniibacter sp.]
MNDQERIIELESRVAFQEDTLEKLNVAVSSQEIEIEQLKRMIKLMNQQLKNLTLELPSSAPGDEPPPPHY